MVSVEQPNIVYGRLLEAAHISGYGFERMTDELEWLLEGDRWQHVGPGYTDINVFLRSIDLSAFNLGEKQKLHKRIKELQPAATATAIAGATGSPERTVRRHVSQRPNGRSTTPDQESDDPERPNGRDLRLPFEHDSKAVADLSREATRRAGVAADRERKREDNRTLTTGIAPPTGPARTLVIDPPWDWGDEGDADYMGRTVPTYASQSIDEIAAMSFGDAADHDAHLYLWITNRSLPKGFRLLDEWGFRYVTCLTWLKPSYGIGVYFRGQTEQILFGVRGSLPLLRQDVGTAFAAPRPPGHSAKPEEFYDLIETCSPGPWLDIYARRDRPGWLTWGAEV